MQPAEPLAPPASPGLGDGRGEAHAAGPAPGGTPIAPACRSCAAGLHDDQRYCLNCGEPVAGRAPTLDASSGGEAPSAVMGGPLQARRASALRPFAALGAATLAGALLTALLIAALGGNSPQPVSVHVAAAKAPVVNVAPASGATPVAEAPFVSDWPGGKGWTVQLQVLPKATTMPSAVAAAKAAAAGAGANGVGALDSDEYPQLPGGSYVVYSGVYKTKAAAVAARKRLGARFADAKVVRIAAAAPAKATKESNAKLKDLGGASGDDYTEKSKKLPDSVVTPGSTAPKDDTPSAPADRGDVETIG